MSKLPTLEYNGLVIKEHHFRQFGVVSIDGNTIPDRSATLYTNADGTANKSIHQKMSVHPDQNITEARKRVLEIPPELILDLTKRTKEYRDHQYAKARVACDPVIDIAAKEYKELKEQFELAVFELEQKHRVKIDETYDSEYTRFDLQVEMFDSETGLCISKEFPLED